MGKALSTWLGFPQQRVCTFSCIPLGRGVRVSNIGAGMDFVKSLEYVGIACAESGVQVGAYSVTWWLGQCPALLEIFMILGRFAIGIICRSG